MYREKRVYMKYSVFLLLLIYLISWTNLLAVEECRLPTKELATSIHQGNFVYIKDGYFWDPVLNKRRGGYWLPHGIAYQTWNRPLGVWQEPDQIEYDFDQMENAHVNSCRVDMVWGNIHRMRNAETGMDWEDWAAGGNWENMTWDEREAWKIKNWTSWGQLEGWVPYLDWEKYDMLIQKAAEHNIKIFALIGYQWPPTWFPTEGYNLHPPDGAHDYYWLSDTMSFSEPTSKMYFRRFIREITAHYSNNRTIVAWILGNEYGYLGLWSNKYEGYDEDSIAEFRSWLEQKYNHNIDALNSVWAHDNDDTPPGHPYLPGYPYNGFAEVDMPTPFGISSYVNNWEYMARNKASWYDLVQWREEAVANFVAFAAGAAREKDRSHLLTYSTVGMQWGEEDSRYHCEDAKKIVDACSKTGVPLDFWSINNYPWGLENHELITGQWGIARAKHDTRLPVLVTEVGFTDTEDMYSGMNDTERQAALIRNGVWEALETGAIGVHVFSWMDRDWVNLREKGFGIVHPDRRIKPGYWMVRDIYNLIEKLDVTSLLAGSQDPTPDIAFLWTDATDSIVNRYEAEMAGLYGVLERLGFEPTFVNREELISGEFKRYKAVVLPRNQKMCRDTYELLDKIVNYTTVKLHADSDLPGIMDEYSVKRHQPQPGGVPWDEWREKIWMIFGIDANNSKDGYETPPDRVEWMMKNVFFDYGTVPYQKRIGMWKYRDKINPQVPTGRVLAYFADNGNPAIVVKNNNAAISLFSLGDDDPITWSWEDRYDVVNAIYRSYNGFGLEPEIRAGRTKLVLADYRWCPDGTLLLSVKNISRDPQSFYVDFSNLATGVTVESLANGGIIDENSNGIIYLELDSEGHDLFHIYPSGPEEKVVILDAPSVVYPAANPPGGGTNYNVKVRYQTNYNARRLYVSFCKEGEPEVVYSPVEMERVEGCGEAFFWISVNDANLDDSEYMSTPEGGNYTFRAWLEDEYGGGVIAESYYKTKLFWGIRPTDSSNYPLPTGQICQGESYDIEFKWEELPEYLSWETTPLKREVIFPVRIGVVYSNKTEAMVPEHAERFERVCEWLRARGYHLDSLGQNESRNGYYILDDEHIETFNADYLRSYFSVIILPGVYVMYDEEIEGLREYLESGPFAVISTDGAVGSWTCGWNPNSGTYDYFKPAPGRIEDLFGAGEAYVETWTDSVSIEDRSHFITHRSHQERPIEVPATSWTTLTTGRALGTINCGQDNYPALIINKIIVPDGERGRVFTYNFGVDTEAPFHPGYFEYIVPDILRWATREIYKGRVELKNPADPEDPDDDYPILTKDFWLSDFDMDGDGTDSSVVSVEIPEGCMTGTDLYWLAYVYPWDSTDPWREHKGFYTSQNDPGYQAEIEGYGVKIFGAPDRVYGGQAFPVWVAYNPYDISYAELTIRFKEKEDNGDDIPGESYAEITSIVNGQGIWQPDDTPGSYLFIPDSDEGYYIEEEVQNPDYDDIYCETFNDYLSSTEEAEYEIVAELKELGYSGNVLASDQKDVELNWAGKLLEFPKQVQRGDRAELRVIWENLPPKMGPNKLVLGLLDPISGKAFINEEFELYPWDIYHLDIPYYVPIGSTYCWYCYIYNPSQVDPDDPDADTPYEVRFGGDDTWRFHDVNYDNEADPVMPEIDYGDSIEDNSTVNVNEEGVSLTIEGGSNVTTIPRNSNEVDCELTISWSGLSGGGTYKLKFILYALVLDTSNPPERRYSMWHGACDPDTGQVWNEWDELLGIPESGSHTFNKCLDIYDYRTFVWMVKIVRILPGGDEEDAASAWVYADGGEE